MFKIPKTLPGLLGQLPRLTEEHQQLLQREYEEASTGKDASFKGDIYQLAEQAGRSDELASAMKEAASRYPGNGRRPGLDAILWATWAFVLHDKLDEDRARLLMQPWVYFTADVLNGPGGPEASP